MKIKDLPKFKRPREKLFEKGSAALKDYELLAILLRTGYQGKSAIDVAKRILNTIPLNKLVKLSPQEISKIKGIGKSRAAIISAAFTLNQRLLNQNQASVIHTPEDVVKVVHYLANKKREHLVGLYLSGNNELITTKVISVGTLTENLIHARELFSPAIKYHAAQVILVHNHPSGSLKPSKEDIKITQQLSEAGKLLDIELADHVIICNKGYFSFKNNQLL